MSWPDFIFIFVIPEVSEVSDFERELFVSLMAQREWTKAVKFYEDILQNKPGYPPAVNALAKIAYDSKDYETAQTLLASLIKKAPHNPVWLNNFGVVMVVRGNLTVARGLFQQAALIFRTQSHAFFNLGCLAVNENALETALDIFLKIVVKEPTHIRALFALSRISKELGRVDDAVIYCHKLIELAPYEAEFQQNLGLVLLKCGDWDAGFQLYGARWNANHLAMFSPELLWQGQDLSGKTILVWSEQGLGDTINFARYLLRLKKLAGVVIWMVQEALANLLRESFPDLLIKDLSEKGEIEYDFQVPLLDLPRLFQARVEDIAPTSAYLKVNEDYQKKWYEYFPVTNELQVGVVWAGNPNHANDVNRSILLEIFRRIFSVGGVKFYNLQKERSCEDEEWIVTFLDSLCGDFTDLSNELIDFQDTAAILQNLDLLISVDTSVAHLAGALARPVWLLLPFDADWRWLLDREDSPWYPTMRLFRQPRPGDWEAVLAQVCQSLQMVVDGKEMLL